MNTREKKDKPQPKTEGYGFVYTVQSGDLQQINQINEALDFIFGVMFMKIRASEKRGKKVATIKIFPNEFLRPYKGAINNGDNTKTENIHDDRPEDQPGKLPEEIHP